MPLGNQLCANVSCEIHLNKVGSGFNEGSAEAVSDIDLGSFRSFSFECQNS